MYLCKKGRCICRLRLDLQALVVSHEPSLSMQLALLDYREELNEVLPANSLCDDDATKKNVIDRVTGGSDPLIHFLVHGTLKGKPCLLLGEIEGNKKSCRPVQHCILLCVFEPI